MKLRKCFAVLLAALLVLNSMSGLSYGLRAPMALAEIATNGEATEATEETGNVSDELVIPAQADDVVVPVTPDAEIVPEETGDALPLQEVQETPAAPEVTEAPKTPEAPEVPETPQPDDDRDEHKGEHKKEEKVRYAYIDRDIIIYADPQRNVKLGVAAEKTAVHVNKVGWYEHGDLYEIVFDTYKTAGTEKWEVGYFYTSNLRALTAEEAQSVAAVRTADGAKIVYVNFYYAEPETADGEQGEEQERSGAYVNANSVNMRVKADKKSNYVAKLTEGTKVNVLGKTTDQAGNVWYKVSSKAGKGYVMANLISGAGSVADLNKPEEKPEQPEEKPEIPEEKPEQPEEKPEIPEEKPEQPEEKPEVPEEKPEVPEEKPEQPEEKPELPEETPADKPDENEDNAMEEKPEEELPEPDGEADDIFNDDKHDDVDAVIPEDVPVNGEESGEQEEEPETPADEEPELDFVPDGTELEEPELPEADDVIESEPTDEAQAEDKPEHKPAAGEKNDPVTEATAGEAEEEELEDTSAPVEKPEIMPEATAGEATPEDSEEDAADDAVQALPEATAGEATEVEPGIDETNPDRQVSIHVTWSEEKALEYGDVVTMAMELSGYEGLDYNVFWQCDKGNGFENVTELDGEYAFDMIVSEENAGWVWRAGVHAAQAEDEADAEQPENAAASAEPVADVPPTGTTKPAASKQSDNPDDGAAE